MLGFDSEYTAVHPKAKFLVKHFKKSAVECSIEKAILLNIVNLFPLFVQDCTHNKKKKQTNKQNTIIGAQNYETIFNFKLFSVAVFEKKCSNR